MDKTKVLIIGTMPPPIGGVTVHIDRFLKRNRDSGRFEINLLDLKKRIIVTGDGDRPAGIIAALKTLRKYDVHHIHVSNNLKILFALIGRLLGKKVVYTHHNSRIKDPRLFKVLVGLCHRVILVNDRNLEYPVVKQNSKKIRSIPAFIEPQSDEALPGEVESILKDYKYVICANSAVDVHYNGKLLYGFDILSEAFSDLAQDGQIADSLLVLVDPQGKLSDIMSKLLSGLGINNKNKIEYFPKSLNFSLLIKKSDLIVRPTLTDGDALTVREALFFGKAVIASDCVIRPEGAVTFRTGDKEDLKLKILEIFKSIRMPVMTKGDFNEPILSVYDELSEGK